MRMWRGILSLAALFSFGCATSSPVVSGGCGLEPVASARALTLTAIDSGLPRTGQWREAFALADIDGDGRLDLVSAPPRKGGGGPAIFLGRGDGTFARDTDAHFPALGFDYGDAAVADLNGDGAPDLAIASHLRGLVAMIAEPGRVFAPWTDGLEMRVPPPDLTSRAIELADWNGDGRPDLLVLDEGPGRFGSLSGEKKSAGLVVFLNRQGTWQRIDSAGEFFGASLASGDLDGDRFADAISGTMRAGEKGMLHFGSASGEIRSAPIEAIGPATIVPAVAMGRRGEVAFATHTSVEGDWCAALWFGRWDGRGLKEALVHSALATAAIGSVALGDLDGDGRDDLAALGPDGGLLLFRRLRRGWQRWDAVAAPAWRAKCAGYHLEIADLDGDGRNEIIAAFAGESTTMFELEGCRNGGGFEVWRVEP